jgi:maltose O-acetyltransferase
MGAASVSGCSPASCTTPTIPSWPPTNQRALKLTSQFNASDPADAQARLALLRELLGSVGEGTEIRPPLHCDYGYQTHIGARTFINFGCVLLDVATITIGDDVQVGPNVQVLTPTHPVEAEPRRAKWEAAKPISVGDNVWLGGGVIICPGVNIGENTVVGAGAVVVRDLPANVIAVGNPAPGDPLAVAATQLAREPVWQRPRPAGAAARRAERPTRVPGTIRPDPGSRWSPRSRQPAAWPSPTAGVGGEEVRP